MLEAENNIYNWEIDYRSGRFERLVGRLDYIFFFFAKQMYGVGQILNIVKKKSNGGKLTHLFLPPPLFFQKTLKTFPELFSTIVMFFFRLCSKNACFLTTKKCRFSLL